MYYCYDSNAIYVHHSLIFKEVFTYQPSFHDIGSDYSAQYFYRCICFQFKRILKYYMKGFYNILNEEDELEQAKLSQRQIMDLVSGRCKLCNEIIFAYHSELI